MQISSQAPKDQNTITKMFKLSDNKKKPSEFNKLEESKGEKRLPSIMDQFKYQVSKALVVPNSALPLQITVYESQNSDHINKSA